MTSIWRKRESNVMTSKWELLCLPVYLLSHSFPFTLFLPQAVSLLLKMTKSSGWWSSHGINSPWYNGEKDPPLPHQTPMSTVFTSKARSAVAESGGGSLNAGTTMQTGVGSTVKPVGTAHSQQAARATAGKGVGGFRVNSALTWSPESKSTSG